MGFLLWAHHGVLSSWGLDTLIVSDLGFLFPLSSASRQLIHDILFCSMVDESSSDPALSYISYYRKDKGAWSGIDAPDTFLLYHFAAGRVDTLPEKLVSSHKHAPGHRFTTGSLARNGSYPRKAFSEALQNSSICLCLPGYVGFGWFRSHAHVRTLLTNRRWSSARR